MKKVYSNNNSPLCKSVNLNNSPLEKRIASNNSPLIKGDKGGCFGGSFKQNKGGCYKPFCVIPSHSSSVIPSGARNLAFVIPRFNRGIHILFSILLSLLLFSFSAVAEEFVPYPHKTGQVLCYNASGGVILCAGAGQDGTYLRGVAWPIGATRWEGIDITGTGTIASKACIRDRLTGLIWQKSVSATTRTWSDAFSIAIAGVNSTNLCGWSDWRLPNITELYSLVDFSKSNQAANFNTTIGFSGVSVSYYWSSTTNAYSTAYAWIVYMNFGDMTYGSKTNIYFVWPVRSGL